MKPPAPFVAALTAWMPSAAVETQSDTWCFRHACALAIEVRWGTEPTVRLGPWSAVFEPEDADEMLDLIAAAAFGRARVIDVRLGEETIGARLEIRVGARWVEAPGPAPRKPWRAWLRKPTEEILHNDVEAPRAIRWGEPGKLPRAPWVGMLANDASEPGTLPIDGELDLHPFKPKEVRDVVLAYLDACRERGITEVRLVHGKGIGNLRRTVHALLDKHDAVVGYRLGGMGEGSWGATIVELRRSGQSG